MAFSAQSVWLDFLFGDHPILRRIIVLYVMSVIIFNPLKTRNPTTGTLANSEDPDKMSFHAPFHQDLHCLLSKNRPSEKEI